MLEFRITCLNDKIKQELIKQVNKLSEKGEYKGIFDELMVKAAGFPECEGDLPVEFEEVEVRKGGRRGGKRSAYQEFMFGENGCMTKRRDEIKGKPFGYASKIMKECAEEWRKLKESRKMGK